jgi:hypothetical protein
LVYDELIRILGQLLVKTVSDGSHPRFWRRSELIYYGLVYQSSFKRYPELRDRFNSVVINFFKEAMVPTNKLVTDMVA